jgi:hypothetical protein
MSRTVAYFILGWTTGINTMILADLYLPRRKRNR